jgi:hypothetical protein
MEIRNVKDYTFLHTSKTKGISVNDRKVSKGVYGQWQFIKLTGAMRKESITGCTQRYIEKHISGRYTKGKVGPDGIVKPYFLTGGVLKP